MVPSVNNIAVVILVMSSIFSASGRKISYPSQPYFPKDPAHLDGDLQAAASEHHRHGRVHIKVYRGPSDGHHAPHGFWVKQPADDDRHY